VYYFKNKIIKEFDGPAILLVFGETSRFIMVSIIENLEIALLIACKETMVISVILS
jgi:hypothetical protein